MKALIKIKVMRLFEEILNGIEAFLKGCKAFSRRLFKFFSR
jgi:hypothetical protein